MDRVRRQGKRSTKSHENDRGDVRGSNVLRGGSAEVFVRFVVDRFGRGVRAEDHMPVSELK